MCFIFIFTCVHERVCVCVCVWAQSFSVIEWHPRLTLRGAGYEEVGLQLQSPVMTVINVPRSSPPLPLFVYTHTHTLTCTHRMTSAIISALFKFGANRIWIHGRVCVSCVGVCVCVNETRVEKSIGVFVESTSSPVILRGSE